MIFAIFGTINNFDKTTLETLIMKTLRFSVILACALAFANVGVVLAEFDAQTFVNQFNGTSGWAFNYQAFNSSGVVGYFTAQNSSLQPTIMAAYNPKAIYNNGFVSFCVEPPNENYALIGTAKLNFTNGNSTKVVSPYNGFNNNALTVGAAFLYRQFATGVLNVPGFNYNNSYGDFQYAMKLLMNPSGVQWENSDVCANKFVQYILAQNGNKRYWEHAYNPNQRYDEIGDYAVFVMNISGRYSDMQDFLYITKADYGNGGGSGVPEPATILLWTLGSAGAFGFGYRRKRNKIALA